MSTTELYNEIEQLSPQEQIALVQQILTGLAHQMPNFASIQANTAKLSSARQRIPGLHSGLAWVSEDFDEPLPDEFWQGTA